MADAETTDHPKFPVRLRLVDWQVRRSGAGLTIEGFDACKRAHIVTGIIKVTSFGGGAPGACAFDADGFAIILS